MGGDENEVYNGYQGVLMFYFPQAALLSLVTVLKDR